MPETWRPWWTNNCWDLSLSPDGRAIAFGTKELYFAVFPAAEQLIGPDPADGRNAWGSGGPNKRWYSAGWLDERRLLYVRGQFDGELQVGDLPLWTFDRVTGIHLALGTSLPGFSQFRARGGHWAAGLAGSPHRAWIDGIELPSPGGWRIEIDGLGLATIAGYQGPTCWKDGILTNVKPVTTENKALVRDGRFVCRIQTTGQIVTWTLDQPALEDVTTLPAGAGGSCPVFCHDWFFQILEHVSPGDTTGVQAYPKGSTGVYFTSRPAGSQETTDAIYRPDLDEFVVASLHDGSRLVVEWIGASVPRLPWGTVAPPIVPPPILPPDPADPTYLKDGRAPNPVGAIYAQPADPDPILPALGRVWFGAFCQATHKFLNADDWARGKPWLRFAGNCAVVTGEPAAALTANDRDSPRPAVIAGIDTIFALNGGGRYDPDPSGGGLAAFWVGPEASGSGVHLVRQERSLGRMICQTLGLQARPFIVYSDTHNPPDLSLLETSGPFAGQTWLALRYYLDPGQGIQDLRNLQAAFRLAVPFGSPVVFIGMSYDRNGNYLDDLRPVVTETIALAKQWVQADPGSLKAVLWFSDGRGSIAGGYGGARWHPELYPIFRGAMAGIFRPAIVGVP